MFGQSREQLPLMMAWGVTCGYGQDRSPDRWHALYRVRYHPLCRDDREKVSL